MPAKVIDFSLTEMGFEGTTEQKAHLSRSTKWQHRRHRIGYVRVSSFDQNPERQLEQTPVSKVFTDKASGSDTSAPS